MSKCSNAHMTPTKGRCVALRSTMRALLSVSDGKMSRKGRMHRGIRFCANQPRYSISSQRVPSMRMIARGPSCSREPGRQREAAHCATTAGRQYSHQTRVMQLPTESGSKQVRAMICVCPTVEAMLSALFTARRLRHASTHTKQTEIEHLPAVAGNKLIGSKTRLPEHRLSSYGGSSAADSEHRATY